MQIDRRTLIAGSAALVAVGVSPAVAAVTSEIESLMRIDEPVALWLVDIRKSLEDLDVSEPMLGALMRMNTLVVTHAPDLFPVTDRMKLGAEANWLGIRLERLDLQWSLAVATYGLPHERSDDFGASSMKITLDEIAAQQVIIETRVRSRRLRDRGIRMRPIIPIRTLGIRADEQTFQPVQAFGTMFATAPYEPPSA